MKPRQVLPYLAALLLLAWILGTLARSGTGGPGILAGSTWLVQLVLYLPVFAVIAMFVMVIFLAVNWKIVSEVLGVGLAARRRMRPKQSFIIIRLVVWVGFWGLALGVLYWKCGGIFCSPTNSTETLPALVDRVVDDSGSPATFSGTIYSLGDFVGSSWFVLPFLALLLVSTVIMVRGIKVSMEETQSNRFLPARVREEGEVAVRDALRVLEKVEEKDPRMRIIACYERMIGAASGLGASVSVDQTARELERGIRRMFQLKGRGIAELTRLFEEARYSLHDMTEGDSELAQRSLLEIGEELNSARVIENVAETGPSS